ncbi:MAG: hypothetical protein AAGD86_06855 [Pseudomonadota bacterium]
MRALVTALILAAGASPALAANDDGGEAAASEETQAMEEVTVLGQMNMSQLRRTVDRAKVDFWDAYNSVNDIEEFRMICDRKADTGSHLKKLSCAPSYFVRASREQTERSLRNRTIGSRNSRGIAASLAKKKEEADAHMVALIEANPELLQKWNYLLQASETYEQRKGSD